MWPVLLAIALMGAEADSPSADELQSQVNHLVKQLSAPELSKRTEAEEKLIALGPRILDLLPQFNDQAPAGDAQKREAVARIRQKLEQQLAEQSARATTITLHAAGKPLSEVLAELTRQSGNKTKDLREKMGQQVTDPKITIDFDKTPYWEALDRTLDQANLSLYHFGDGDEMGIVARGEKQLPRSGRANYAGPLRIEATRLAADRDLRTPANSSLKLGLEIAWEPRLRPITIQQPLHDVHATDDQGTAIQIDGVEGALEAAINAGSTATEFELPLVNPPRTARSIASVKGRLKALLPGKVETFEFADLAKAKKVEQHKAGVTVTLDEVRKNEDAWEVRVRVHFDNAGNGLESFRTWIYNNEAYLVGPDNKPIIRSGFTSTLQTDTEIGVAYLFDLPNGPDGLKFVYKTPAAINSISLDYELKNLPLP